MCAEAVKSLLPDFTRVSWVSELARQTWKPRFERIAKAWNEIGWRSVSAGLRAVFLTAVKLEDLPRQTADWCDHGLASLPLAFEGGHEKGYSAGTPALRHGEPIWVRVVVGSLADVAEARRACEERNEDALGALLGYPTCCRAFFRRVWIESHCMDTTWAMAVNTVASHNPAEPLDVAGPPAANVLWRWVGIRAVPHLPCRCDCRESAAFGQALLKLGREIGFTEEISWMEEILSWPVEWSALHGIAEIKTPILKVSTRTDLAPGKRVVRRQGSGYPAEGARGLVFPFKTPPAPAVTGSASFRRGMTQSLEGLVQLPQPDWYHRDNGFSQREAMDRAHTPLVSLARTVISSNAVLDLGCGNGALLAKICSGLPGCVAYGVDRNEAALAHAKLLLPEFAGNFYTGNLFDVGLWSEGRRYGLVILMIGRLFEVSDELRTRAIDALRRSADTVLLYKYPGWSPESLTRLIERAGLGPVRALAGDCALVKPRTPAD